MAHRKNALTARQREALVFIRRFVDQHGYAPSLREIADALGLKGRDGAKVHVDALVVKGFVTRGDGPRTLAVVSR